MPLISALDVQLSGGLIDAGLWLLTCTARGAGCSGPPSGMKELGSTTVVQRSASAPERGKKKGGGGEGGV